MKTKNKTLLFLLAAMLLSALCGCQLAREDMAADARADRLVGVLVTAQYLDLFDFEGYLNENINKLSGGDFVISGDDTEYQGRLYATPVSKTLTSETGETFESLKYVFEGLAGIAYFSATVKAAPGQESYVPASPGEEISDSHMEMFTGDDEDRRTLTGTLYVAATGAARTYYYNPVYQSADGSVYLLSGDGVTFAGGVDGEGGQFSQTLSASYTETVNGEKKTDSISITLDICTMFAPEKIVVAQMGADSDLLLRAEYAPGALPKTLAPEEETAYLVVETHTRDVAGNPTVSRDIYSGGAENITGFFMRADGICVKRSTQILWPR